MLLSIAAARADFLSAFQGLKLSTIYMEYDREQLFHETKNMIYSLGIRLFHNEEDALDFSQDIYLKAFSKLDQFEGRSKFSTWLYSLALNDGLNRLKKRKKEIFLDDKNLDLLEIGDEQAKPFDPFLELNKKERRELIAEILESLEEKYRIPLLLFYYEGMSYAKISEKLGINEGTLKANLHRGKLRLRKKLLEKEI